MSGEEYYGHVPTGFTVLQVGQRSMVRQFPDQYWQRYFGNGRPSRHRRNIAAAVAGRGHIPQWKKKAGQ